MEGIQQVRVNPLVRVASNKDLEEAQAKKDAETPGSAGLDFNPLSQVTESVLGGHIRRAWDRNKLHKERVSQGLLYCLRARRGVYSATELTELQEGGGT